MIDRDKAARDKAHELLESDAGDSNEAVVDVPTLRDAIAAALLEWEAKGVKDALAAAGSDSLRRAEQAEINARSAALSADMEKGWRQSAERELREAVGLLETAVEWNDMTDPCTADCECVFCDARAFLARHPVAAQGAPSGSVPQLGDDTPWPLRDVLDRLSNAVWHSLSEHGCDQHGHEETLAAYDQARRFIVELDEGRTIATAPVAAPAVETLVCFQCDSPAETIVNGGARVEGKPCCSRCKALIFTPVSPEGMEKLRAAGLVAPAPPATECDGCNGTGEEKGRSEGEPPVRICSDCGGSGSKPATPGGAR